MPAEYSGAPATLFCDPAKPLHCEGSDPAPPLSSLLAGGSSRGSSYPEMLSQLGHHLEDLGSILVVHGLRHAGVLDLAATPPTTSCCNIRGPCSSSSSKHPQAAALEAARHDLQFRLANIQTQRQPDKLWELVGGMKSSPPPVSPWFFDPAVSGRTQNAKETNGSSAVQHLERPHTVIASGQTLDIHVGSEMTMHHHTQSPSGHSGVELFCNANGSASGVPSQHPAWTIEEPHRGGKSVFTIIGDRLSTGSDMDHLRSTISMMQAENSMQRQNKKDLLIGKAKHGKNDEVKKARLVSEHPGTSAVFEEEESEMSEEKPAFQMQDSCVAIVILMNALVMGASADIEWEGGWDVVEYVFTAFFTSEMLYKMRNFGWRGYFRGPDWQWNVFDFVVVTIAIIDLLIAVIIKAMQAGDSVDLSKFTVVKLARLGRLARLIRLLRFKMFKELKMMITGVFSGLRVLFWAIVLLWAFIFLLAMVIRNVYMEEDWVYLNQSFGSVPWSMFTLFTCFTDGCTAHDGVPLIALFYKRYGAYFMVCYTLVFLFVSVGLFNLIMAIFVDNVMESTRQRKTGQRELNYDKQEQRLRGTVMEVIKRAIKALKELKKEQTGFGDKKFRATMLEQAQMKSTRLNSMLLTHPCLSQCLGGLEFMYKKLMCCRICRRKKPPKDEEVDEEDEIDVPDNLVIERKLFNLIIEDPDMDDMLEVLDISTSNRWELFDVLDADMSGNLDLEELVVGLMSMRGPPEKSDIVANLLCARRTLKMIQELATEAKTVNEQIATEFPAILSALQDIAHLLVPLRGESAKQQQLAVASADRLQPAADRRSLISA